jgi:hypothetical protein
MKTEPHKRSNMKSASFVHHQILPARCISVLSPFLRHLNTGTLAFIMLVALALLSSTRGKEAEIRQSAPVPPAPCLGSSTVVKAGDNNPLYIGGVPGTLDRRTEPLQGYLKVYSATDEFNDGGLAYYSHSSYAIYKTDGALFKTVENHVSLSDESPELVALPAGSYLVIARSNRHGDVSIRVAIEAAQLTVLDLDIGENAEGQLVSRKSSRLADK